MKSVSAYYCEGIREGREMLTKYGIEFGVEAMDGLNRLCRQFDAQNPVGQMLRGAHYPSHTMWTGWICWALTVAALQLRLRRERPLAAA